MSILAFVKLTGYSESEAIGKNQGQFCKANTRIKTQSNALAKSLESRYHFTRKF